MERTKMGPYMKALERLVGYKSLKARYSRGCNPVEIFEDEDENEVSFKTVYKNPIIERDEKISTLQKEQLELKKQLPNLQENLLKAKMELEAMQKAQNLKTNRFRKAALVTEQKVAETIRTDPSFLTNNPHLISLLSLFQDRDDFNVDTENGMVRPVQEKDFLKGIVKDIESLSNQTDVTSSESDLYKERLGEVKNLVLESVKKRWIRPGRRDSTASLMSSNSKRGREGEDDILSKISRSRAASPVGSHTQ